MQTKAKNTRIFHRLGGIAGKRKRVLDNPLRARLELPAPVLWGILFGIPKCCHVGSGRKGPKHLCIPPNQRLQRFHERKENIIIKLERIRHLKTLLRSNLERLPLTLICLGVFFFAAMPAFAQAGTSINSYVTKVTQLVEEHRQETQRLSAPAELTAKAMIAGGRLFLGGHDRAWIEEGDGRAGGLTGIRTLASPDGARKGDVVWLSYSSGDYAEELSVAKRLEDKGCLVFAFGPRPPDKPAGFTHWIESFTPWQDTENLGLMGNILSLWTLTAELTAYASRQGRTFAFYQSDSVEGARERNHLYEGIVFHDGVPSMAAVPAGVLSHSYLDYIKRVLDQISVNEMGKIVRTGQEIGHRAATGHPAVMTGIGHMLNYIFADKNEPFVYMDIQTERKALESTLGRDGYLVFLGYVGVPLDLWRSARRAGAKAVWIVAPLPNEIDFGQFGDVVIDQHWRIGDCSVTVPGYDVRILPPSGIAQVFILEIMKRAAAAR